MFLIRIAQYSTLFVAIMFWVQTATGSKPNINAAIGWTTCFMAWSTAGLWAKNARHYGSILKRYAAQMDHIIASSPARRVPGGLTCPKCHSCKIRIEDDEWYECIECGHDWEVDSVLRGLTL